MKKGTIIMISITVIFIFTVAGIFIGRISTDGTIRIHARNSVRNESIDEEDIPSGLININTATSEQLQELPGIGISTAEAIIAYRDENGPFKYKKDLMKVSGIGEKTYEDLKSMITVKDDE